MQIVFFLNFFLCVSGFFFDLGLEVVAGHAQKRMEKNRNVWERMEKYRNVQKSRKKAQKGLLSKFNSH